MATTAFSFDLNKEFDPNWEEDSAQRIFSGMTDQEKKPIDQTVVETGVKSLQPERSYTPAKEGEGRLTSDMTGNPLDDFEAPLKQEAPVVESEEPDEPSIGRIISDGYNYISQVKMVQSGRTGRNSREVAREKALDNQAIFQAYSAMQDRLSERGYERGLVDVLGTHNGGGLRSAEDIDRLFKIKQEGITFQTEDGRTARLDPDAPWETIMEADRKTRGVKIEGAAGDPVKRIKDANDALKPLLDENGKPLPGKEAVVEFLYNDIDAASGAPTGAAAYSDQFSRLQNKEARMNNAMVAGVGYGEISKENLPQEIVRIREQSVALAADKAPYFDSQEGLKTWFADPATRNLPAFVKINEARVLVKKNGDDPNILDLWSPTEKNWGVFDFNKKEAPPEGAKATPTPSSSNEAGKKLNKLTAPVADLTSRYTPQELFEKAGDRVIDAGLNIGDYFATGVRNNVLAPALEFSAGVAGKELDLEDLPNPSFKDRKWKSLTPKERAALLGRSSPGLTIMEAGLKAK